MGVKTHEVVTHDTKAHYAWYVWCPACDQPHGFDARWTFNGNHEAPTFRASMLVRSNYGDPPVPTVCHSFLTDGVWQYLGDCTHAMKGQSAPAPDWAATRYGR